MSRQAGSEALISDKEITDIENSFKEIKDVYIKMIEPTKCIPIEILDTVIGYYYIQDEDINPLTGIVTNNLYFTRFNDKPSSNVSIIDRALVPTSPSNMHLVRDVVLIMIVSFAGVSAIIFVIFYFDDTLRSVDEIESEMALPVIAKVYKDNSGIDLIVDKKPNAIASESIRTLRTNLQFSAVDSSLKTILVTSSVPAEGKSFIAANLAVSFAQTGKKVLIIDCDLRKGRQHKIFGVSGKNGLSNLLIGDITKSDEYIAETKIKNLSLMPRGTFPPNPSELLNSKKNASLIKLLSKYYDIVILDGAPIVGLSDSLILSSLVDKVLLISALGHTPKTELKNTKKALENVNANIAGCIANNISSLHGGYGSYYYYYGEKE
jgi:capsular exopolysaccharide synthesis family protein